MLNSTKNGENGRMKNKNKLIGAAAALAANTIFGFNFIFSKMALSAAHPLIILSVRFTVAFIVMSLLTLTGKFRLSLKGKPKKKLLIMALAQPLFYFIFELYGLSLVSSALSGVIIALVPVAVMLLSTLFLGEKPGLLQGVCTAVSLISVSVMSIISNDGKENRISGILLLIAAVLCAAVFNILSRGESERFSPFERTWFMFSVSALGFNAAAIAVLHGKYISELVAAAGSYNFWVAIFYLAVVSSVAAFMLYNYSTALISATRAASFSNIITVVTVIAGVTVLHEHFTPVQYILCAFIILGVWGVNSDIKR